MINSLRENTNLLQSLELFNSQLVFGRISVNFDVKHLLKRLRGILISNCRQICLIKRSINKSCISALYPQLNYLLNPSDKQNVPYAVLLFQGLTEGTPLTNVVSHDLLIEIDCLNMIVKPLLEIFTKPTLNLFDQLISLAFCSHMLLFIYRKWRKNFLTKDLYCDIQATIQDAFMVVYKFHLKNPNLCVYLYQLGSDNLENIFSIIRTLTHSSSCDLLELVQRYKLAMVIENIYSQHPNWKKASRVSSTTTDHCSIASWTGKLDTNHLSEVNLKSIWKYGRNKAYEYLLKNGYTERELIINNEEINILNPLEALSFSQKSSQRQIEEEEEDQEEETQIVSNESDFIEMTIDDTLLNNESSKEFENNIEYGGQVYFKSNAVANLIHCQSKLSNIRHSRHYCVDMNNIMEETSVVITDLLATIVSNKMDKSYYIVVMSIDKIERGSEIFDHVDIEEINQYSFTGTILQFENVEDQIVWNNKYLSQIKTSGSLCCQIKSQFEKKDETCICKISMDALKEVKIYFKNFIDQCGNLLIPKIIFSYCDNLVIRNTLNILIYI